MDDRGPAAQKPRHLHRVFWRSLVWHDVYVMSDVQLRRHVGKTVYCVDLFSLVHFAVECFVFIFILVRFSYFEIAADPPPPLPSQLCLSPL